ncbi:hypothetical protein ACQ4PT_041014 [Festuca glaucescens]
MACLTPSLPWSAAKLQFHRRRQDIGTIAWELQFRGSDGTDGELLPELQLPLELHCTCSLHGIGQPIVRFSNRIFSKAGIDNTSVLQATDVFASVEHLLRAFTTDKKFRQTLFKDLKIDENELKEAISAVCDYQRVTDQMGVMDLLSNGVENLDFFSDQHDDNQHGEARASELIELSWRMARARGGPEQRERDDAVVTVLVAGATTRAGTGGALLLGAVQVLC